MSRLAGVEGGHARGREDAPVTLEEYADFECPYCGGAYLEMKKLQTELGARLRVVFHHFPLSDMHPHAQHAAEAAEAAGAQGKFWEMHDTLFEHQDALDDRSLMGYAKELGLDTERFERDLREHTHTGAVKDEAAQGERRGVSGTPTFFINGDRYEGRSDAASLLEAMSETAGAV